MEELLKYIEKIEDHRRAQGVRYPFSAFVCMIILAYMSGQYSMQSVRRYFVNNEEELTKLFGLSYGVPSYAHIRTFLSELDFDQINTVFGEWACQFVKIGDKVWVGMDGKALRSTVTDCHSSQQNFQSMVGAFISNLGITIRYTRYENGKASEPMEVRELIKSLSGLGVVITLDAVHCEKKRSKQSWSLEMIS